MRRVLRKMRKMKPGFSSDRAGEWGVTLIETLVALALFGLVGVIFLSGLATSSTAVMVSQERVAAESLAKAQMEDIKAQDYAASYSGITVPSDLAARGYDIALSEEDIQSGQLQKVTVTVTRNGDTVLTLVDYKMNR